MYSIEVLWKALNSKGSGNNERFISKRLKGVKTLRVTLCFNYMAKEFFCSLNLLFICNNFSVLTMLGDGFTSFSLFLNELKQSQVEKMASDKTIKSISQAQRVVMSNEISFSILHSHLCFSLEQRASPGSNAPYLLETHVSFG